MRVIFLLLIFFGLTCFSINGEEAPTVIKVGTISVAKKWSDIYSEISRKILEKAGLKSNILVTPYLRVKNALEDGSIHMSIMFRSDDLDKYTVAIGKIREKKIVILGKKGANFKTLSNLQGKLVGTQRGTHYDASFDKDKKILKQFSNGYEQNILLVLKGRVDAIIGDYNSIISVAQSMEYSESDFGSPLILSQKSSWLLLSKKSYKTIDHKKIVAAYKELAASGEIEHIIRTYPAWLNK